MGLEHDKETNKYALPVLDNSPEDCPVVDIMNFRFGIFSSEPPKDL